MVRLTQEQKQSLYKDGYLVLKNAVPIEMVDRARGILNRRMGQLRNRGVAARDIKSIQDVARSTFLSGDDAVFLEMYNNTSVKKTVEALFGSTVQDARGLQVASNYPSEPSRQINEAGYYDRDTPFYGWCGHLDGLWNGATRTLPIDKPPTTYQRRKWYQDPSTNTCTRCYPEFNANIKNFTALVGVALSDQRKEGVGNLGVLKGAHHAMEDFFKMQAAAGGPVGPDGPGWERINKNAPNGHGLNHYPDMLRKRYCRGAATTPDGLLWPKPTLVKLAPGDAVIAHFSLPHSATRVEGPDPRTICYYRVTSDARPSRNRECYPEALTDIWKEWGGMSGVVRANRRKRKKGAV